MDRSLALLALALAGFAQNSTTGIWTLEQVTVPIGRQFRLLMNTQPRFVSLWTPRPEVLVINAFVGYQFRKHLFWVGGNRYEGFLLGIRPQWRALVRYQYAFPPAGQLQLALEQRWRNGQPFHRIVRPQIRYLHPLGPVALGLTNELLLHPWRAYATNPTLIFQNRYWLFLSFPRGKKYEVEVGYLQITAPNLSPRHRLWLAFRVFPTASKRKEAPESGTTGPANAVQSPPPESPAESLPP